MYPAKISFRNANKIKTFLDESKLRDLALAIFFWKNCYKQKGNANLTKIWNIGNGETVGRLNIWGDFVLNSKIMFDTQNKNYLSGDFPPCSTGFPPRWGFWEPICISALSSLVVRGCIQLRWIFFEDSVHLRWPVSCWVICECACSNRTECSAVFDQKCHDPCAHPPHSPDLALSDTLFVSPLKKVLKGKCFANVEEMKQKTAEQKGIKIDKSKNCFQQWKKHLN